MFRQMRNIKRQLKVEDVDRILKSGEFGVLGTVGEDGYPYAVPLSYVYSDGFIYFHCALEGHKLDNIKFNDKVSFCVVGETEVLPDKFSTKYESVIIFGKAYEINGPEKKNALVALIDKYSFDYKKEGNEYIENSYNNVRIFKIEIEHATAKGRI